MRSEIVPGNRWDRLAPPAVDALVPSRRVSICIPVRDGGSAFGHLLTSIAAVRYPPDLLEVVIVDDGSAEPVEVDGVFDPTVAVVVHRCDGGSGFGASAARNAAARVAAGEVLLFVDADMIVSPSLVAAMARWFEASPDSAVLGAVRYVDAGVVDGQTLAADLGSGRFVEIAEQARLRGQEWRATLVSETGQLTVDDVDLYRLVTGAVLAVRRDRFLEVGGFREIAVRGVGDTEFGYRLLTNGAVLIPEPAALAWHQGPATLRGAATRAHDETRRPILTRLVPVDPDRPRRPDPVDGTEVVPVASVAVDRTGADPGVAAATLERIRSADGSDVDAALVDGREVPPDFAPAFLHVWTTPEFAWGPGTLSRLVSALSAPDVGLVTVAGRHGPDFVAVTTRALRRAVHAGGPADALAATAGFGHRLIAAERLDLTRLEPGVTPSSLGWRDGFAGRIEDAVDRWLQVGRRERRRRGGLPG